MAGAGLADSGSLLDIFIMDQILLQVREIYLQCYSRLEKDISNIARARVDIFNFTPGKRLRILNITYSRCETHKFNITVGW